MSIRLSRSPWAVFGVVLTLCWHSGLFAETQWVLTPTRLNTTKGRVSNQPLDVLSVQDQTGRDDDWNAYKEFYTGTRGYAGVFIYQLEPDIQAADLSTLSMQAGFKGPQAAEQRWRWQIRDFEQGRWVDLADNAGVRS